MVLIPFPRKALHRDGILASGDVIFDYARRTDASVLLPTIESLA
ncbi:hypothetical protein [Rhizobium mayense]|uniref:Uncharacterized protein n=1 Tax=Rhizobium mayense TaxID=1312184 RepID=A0ABT7K6X6_9HYPH|nr:hypothetical protein [Rhizobium mayense]MDL2403922.1 hypothetical protein [Rhizobium mayense]